MARRTWALKVVDDCAKMSDLTQQRYDEIETMRHALFAAIDNLHLHIKPLDEQLAGAQNWSSALDKDHQPAIANTEALMRRLESCYVNNAIVDFMCKGGSPTKQQATLYDLVAPGTFQQAASVGSKALQNVSRVVTELGQGMDRLVASADKVSEALEKGSTEAALKRRTESLDLLQDIEAAALKVSNDYETVLGLDNNSKNVSQASRTALQHTKHLLPILSKRSQEMYGMLTYSTEARNTASVEAVSLLQQISVVNTMCREVHAKFDDISISEDEHQALETLDEALNVPISYAAFIAEAVRRQEWQDKVKNDSSTLANELAAFHDEEERRRRKWQKTNSFKFLTNETEVKVPGVEVNVRSVSDQWPSATRADLQAFLQSMKIGGFHSDQVQQVTRIIAELNSPTKQQTKRANAFKNGSFHESALGRSALLVRGDDDLLRSLQEDKARLETKNKSAESRIRRLEDLLHRSVSSRTQAIDTFPTGRMSPDIQYSLNPLQSPRLNDDTSRRSSVSSRRFSSNLAPDEKSTAQRIINLEAELIVEREKAASLERELSARASSTNDIKSRMEEANSTKQDLLQNLEAQQNEFGIERKSLEAEIRELKSKLESYEDEVDRIVGSRETERAQVEDQIREVRQALERERAEAAAETQKAQGQVDYLRNDAKLQRESNESLSKQVLRLEDNARELTTRAVRAEELAAGHLKVIHALHSLLNASDPAPADAEALTDGLLGAARSVLDQLSLHNNELSMAKNDLAAAEKALAETKKEVVSTSEKLKNEEMESFQLRETLASDRAKFQSLEAELADERQQLSQLRGKFAAGETGSESLRSRVEEEERKVTALSDELAGKRSRVGSLEEELRSMQERLETTQAKLEEVTNRLDARTSRSKDLTERLYTQNDRLRRLLERMSYSIAREGDSMVIQRIPKTERANANDSSDPGNSGRRSVSGLMSQPMAESADLDLLYWMHTPDVDSEAEKYQAYLNEMGNFDTEAFCETMYKRVKDAEHAARKYTREARGYRDKYQRAQKEAHEKIAYKNFKDGDLALFLPTRNQTTGAWAAFNIGAPHYFLHEQDSHKLRSRDWLLARIQKIEERVVDLAKSMTANAGDGRSIGEASTGGDSYEDDNPFDLSDGLRWYLIDAAEEKPGAPTTPGLAKSTVAATSVDATGTIRRTKKSATSGVENVSKTLTRSLDSRRSSSNSKKAVPFLGSSIKAAASISDASGISKQLPAPIETGEASTTVVESSKLDISTDMSKSPSKQPEGSPTNEVRIGSAVVAIDDLLGP